MPEWNGALLATVGAAGALVNVAADLPSHVAVVTPFWPRLVSASFHGRFAAAGPTHTVVPPR